VFEAGKPYLVYADDRNGQWHSSLCSRTAPLADARADVAYAHAIPERTLATVEGTVSVEGEAGELSNRASVVVRVQGTKLTARTDRTGHYKLQLPAGTYTLAVDDPGTRIRWGEAPTVALPRAAACARRDIIESWTGRIQGKLTEPSGAPVVTRSPRFRRARTSSPSAVPTTAAPTRASRLRRPTTRASRRAPRRA